MTFRDTWKLRVAVITVHSIIIPNKILNNKFHLEQRLLASNNRRFYIKLQSELCYVRILD